MKLRKSRRKGRVVAGVKESKKRKEGEGERKKGEGIKEGEYLTRPSENCWESNMTLA